MTDNKSPKIIRKPKLPITKPGIYAGIPLETYHSDAITAEPSVSSSGLRTMWAKSPAHFFDEWAHNPKRERKTPTRPMILGSAAHHLLLGEKDFWGQFVMQPETYRDKKTAIEKKWTYQAEYCRQWRDKAHDKGMTIITKGELEDIRGMVRSLQLEPLVDQGVLAGAVECSLIVKDKITGLWLKSRPDVVPTEGQYVDVKIMDDISAMSVSSAMRSFGLHIQAGMAWEVAEQLGMPFDDYTLICIESGRPYCVSATQVPDEDIARGRRQARAMINKVASCIDSGIWPGPDQGALRKVGLSADERARIDARLQAEGAR